MKQSIAVIMTVHNRRKTTIECIRRFYSCRGIENYEVAFYMMDDGCTDGTAEAVALQFPQVIILNGDGNLFWNRGMYYCWEEASKNDFDFYLWLNDDTIVFPCALSELLEISCLYKHKVIVVGEIKEIDRNEVSYGGIVKKQRIPPNGYPQTIDCFNGNVVLIPRAVYRVLGNLDYRFCHSHGDIDYGLRANENGVESVTTRCYIGECCRHESLKKWCNPEVPLKKRWEALFLPTGYAPDEVFYFERKHGNIIKALFHQVTLYMRVLFPSIWIYMGHNSKP